MSIEQNTKILASDVVNSLSEKAPTSHASNDITYGVGTDTDYGHVKLSDSVSTLDSLSGIAASPKAVDDGLSSLFDDIITAAENAANTTTVPDNVAVELNNRIDELTTKNTEQDEVIAGKLDKSGGTMTGDILFGNRGKISIDESADYVVLTSYTDSKIGAKVICRGLNAPVRPGSVLLIGRTSDGLEGTPVWVMPDGNIEVNGKNLIRTVNGTAADASGNVVLNISAPVTSVNGMTGAVTISTTPSTVKGVIGSAVAANSTSLKLPNGGTWFVFNTGTTGVENGVHTNTGTSVNYFSAYGGTYSGGTTVYAKIKSGGETNVVGKLAAIRIS